ANAMKRHWSLHRRLNVERLEDRQLLCGVAMTASVFHTGGSAAAVVGRSQLVTASNSIHANDSGAGDESTETHLFTTLTNSSGEVVGTASFESKTDGTTTKQELLITVAGGAANASYAVTVGTTSLGTLTTDANGNGHLLLTSGSTSSSSSAK